MIRVAVRKCLGFLSGQASNQFDSRLVIQALLVYIGACPGEGQAQALEQFAPVRELEASNRGSMVDSWADHPILTCQMPPNFL